MLSSHQPSLRFASIRTLNNLAITKPDVVSLCNTDIETLITDSNRNVATFAITTLLKVLLIFKLDWKRNICRQINETNDWIHE